MILHKSARHTMLKHLSFHGSCTKPTQGEVETVPWFIIKQTRTEMVTIITCRPLTVLLENGFMAPDSNKRRNNNDGDSSVLTREWFHESNKHEQEMTATLQR